LVEFACRQDLAYLRPNGRLTSPFLQTEDIREEVIGFARAVLSRWGHPATPPAPEQATEDSSATAPPAPEPGGEAQP
jgi:hypothetical protein